MPARLPVVLAAVLLAGGAGRCEAGDRYFVVVFGSQSVPKVPQLAHIWLTAFRVPDGQTAPADVFTISWLPAGLVIRDLRVWPEPGVNLTLDQTLRHVTGQRQRVSAWGPYEVPADTFGRFVRQYQRVAGGEYRYQAGDALNPDPLVANCIRAVSEADPRFGRARYPVLRVAEPVGTHIARLLFEQNRIIDPTADHSGLLAELGVTAYPVTCREFRVDTGVRAWDVGWRRRSGSGERGVLGSSGKMISHYGLGWCTNGVSRRTRPWRNSPAIPGVPSFSRPAS